jgi:hypothetical protein
MDVEQDQVQRRQRIRECTTCQPLVFHSQWLITDLRSCRAIKTKVGSYRPHRMCASCRLAGWLSAVLWPLIAGSVLSFGFSPGAQGWRANIRAQNGSPPCAISWKRSLSLGISISTTSRSTNSSNDRRGGHAAPVVDRAVELDQDGHDRVIGGQRSQRTTRSMPDGS